MSWDFGSMAVEQSNPILSTIPIVGGVRSRVMSGQFSDTRWTEETFRALTQESADIVSLLDASGRLLFNSAASSRISGFTPDELEGVDTFELIHPDDREAVRREMGALLTTPGGRITVRYRYRHKSGGWTWMEAVATNQLDNPAVRGVVADSRDISERVALEEERRRLGEQLVRGEALESLATLAGGVAHDFNNLLAVILGETELLQVEKDEAERQCSLESIGNAARRAAELTSLLLTYAGRGRYRCESVDLASLVTRRAPELQRILGECVRLDVAVDAGVRPVEANEARLWQIMESLVANAAEAFAGPGGEVRVKVGMTYLTEQDLRDTSIETQQEPGTAVYLEVTDTACGMDATVLQKVFAPFFTTKLTGRGLGLAAVAGLVRGFRGSIRVRSEPHVGTTFTVYFRPSLELTEPQSQPLKAWRGEGLALVIDDEPQVANVTARVLSAIGFDVEAVGSGAEALQLYGHRLESVRVVVLDMIMPGMDGGETFRCLRELRADLPVLFYSGFTGEVAQQELRVPGTRFLQKPFSRELLGVTLQQLLGER